MKKWSSEETKLLQENYSELGKFGCMKLLNRTEGSIRRKATNLFLKSNVHNKPKKNSKYIQEMLNADYEPLEPYIKNNVKILHRHKICGYEWKVTPNGLTRTVSCPQCFKKPYSKTAIRWIESFNKNIQHAENGGECIVAGYKVDGYDKETNTVYEYHGDVFHGNLDRFNSEDKVHPYTGQTVEELWEATYLRMYEISKIATVVYIWEYDYKRGLKECQF